MSFIATVTELERLENEMWTQGNRDGLNPSFFMWSHASFDFWTWRRTLSQQEWSATKIGNGFETEDWKSCLPTRGKALECFKRLWPRTCRLPIWGWKGGAPDFLICLDLYPIHYVGKQPQLRRSTRQRKQNHKYANAALAEEKKVVEPSTYKEASQSVE